jgi:methionyl-tRNA synthetase
VTLRNLVDRHGPDALRYYLLREIPWDSDGNFTWERYTRYTAELADGYGNLVSRVLAMIRKYVGGTVPGTGEPTALDRAGDEAITRYREAMDACLLHEGATAAWSIVDGANRFVEEQAPWTLAKHERKDELDRVLAALARAVVRITVLLSPFMPTKTQAVWTTLGLDGGVADVGWHDLETPKIGDREVEILPPLFPKAGGGAVTA